VTLYGYPRETPAPDDAPSPDEASALPPAPVETGYADPRYADSQEPRYSESFESPIPEPPAPKGYRGTRRAPDPEEPLDRSGYLPPRNPAEPLMPAEPMPGASGPHWSDPRWPVADAVWPDSTPAPAGSDLWSAESQPAPPAQPIGEPFPPSLPPYEPAANGHALDAYLSPRFAPNGFLDAQPSFNGFAVNGSTPAPEDTASRFAASDDLWTAGDHSGPAEPSGVEPGYSAFGQPDGFSAFGQETGLSSFDQPSDAGLSSFGQPSEGGLSSLGQPSEGGYSSFGQPSEGGYSSFGQPSDGGYSSFGQPDGWASAGDQAEPHFAPFGQPDSDFSAFGHSDPGFEGFGQPGRTDTSHDLSDGRADPLLDRDGDIYHGRSESPFDQPESWTDAAFGQPGAISAESPSGDIGRPDLGATGQIGRPDQWATDATTTFSGRVPVSPAPTMGGPAVPAPPTPVLPPTPPIGQAPTVALSAAVPAEQTAARPAPDWTQIEIPDDDDQVVPWDSKPLLIAILAAVILVLLGIASGVATSKIFYPGQTVTTWHPPGPAQNPPK
jgi:hypothetical protein